MNCSIIWICARRDIDLPWLILLVCCWCAMHASEHFLTISLLFLPVCVLPFRRASARALAHTFIYIDTVWWGRANVSIYFVFIWKCERHLNKESIHLRFSSSSSSSKHVHNGQIITTNQLRILHSDVVKLIGKTAREIPQFLFFSRISSHRAFRNRITGFFFEWNRILHKLWVIWKTYSIGS